MSDSISLGQRMKTYYEEVPKTRLMRRTPVIIRIDGKAFHTFTRGFVKPFDLALMEAMQLTLKDLCSSIQGCVLGYTQSDEISLLLVDYQRLDSSAWFDYEIQKLCSVAASIATSSFNRRFAECVAKYETATSDTVNAARKRKMYTALFDARCFNIPKEEVANYFLWRQLDAERNSIQMVAQSLYSPSKLHKKNTSELCSMCEADHGVVWGNLPTIEKRGTCCVKDGRDWIIDCDIPRFIGDKRAYIENLVFIPEE